MRRLTTYDHWDSKLKGLEQKILPQKSPASKSRFKNAVRRLLGERALAYIRNYSDYLLWEVIYPKYLPSQSGLKAVEIGSAPGHFLLKLHKNFGFVPFGIEYTESGAEVNRQVFATNNIDPENVFHVDFFSDEFHRQYASYFDIVISRGFIEHFDDVKEVIDRHMNLLVPGGHLVVSVPNKRGMNYLFTLLFHRQEIAMHNIRIMTRREFRKQFDDGRLEPLFCDYYGIFTFNQFNTRPNSPMRFVLSLCRFAQFGLNALFWLVFRRRGPETPWASPYLLYIGMRKPE